MPLGRGRIRTDLPHGLLHALLVHTKLLGPGTKIVVLVDIDPIGV
jgi:hypothetical protein